MNIESYVSSLAEAAKKASRQLLASTAEHRLKALDAMANVIQEDRDFIRAENNKDVEKAYENKIDQPLIDRLVISDSVMDRMIDSLKAVRELPDIVGEITDLRYQPSGIQVGSMRVPIGVFAMIYESRPNVTLEAASLAVKSGNACILRGGSEAFHSNQAIALSIRKALSLGELPEDSVQLFDTTDRSAVDALLSMDAYVDVLVPRGGKGLIERVSKLSKIPVIKHLDGICHTYIDAFADQEKAIDIAFNAKTAKYAVCNAMETLLIHASADRSILEILLHKYHQHGVEVRGCPKIQEFSDAVLPAQPSDWAEEYLAPIISIKQVSNLDEAIEHINSYGSQHTDVIISEHHSRVQRFFKEVDSSSVMVNTSSRFADGFEYGLGAEIGISTDKLHARGPVGIEGLTTKKFIVFGDGHIRK